MAFSQEAFVTQGTENLLSAGEQVAVLYQWM